MIYYLYYGNTWVHCQPNNILNEWKRSNREGKYLEISSVHFMVYETKEYNYWETNIEKVWSPKASETRNLNHKQREPIDSEHRAIVIASTWVGAFITLKGLLTLRRIRTFQGWLSVMAVSPIKYLWGKLWLLNQIIVVWVHFVLYAIVIVCCRLYTRLYEFCIPIYLLLLYVFLVRLIFTSWLKSIGGLKLIVSKSVNIWIIVAVILVIIIGAGILVILRIIVGIIIQILRFSSITVVVHIVAVILLVWIWVVLVSRVLLLRWRLVLCVKRS